VRGMRWRLSRLGRPVALAAFPVPDSASLVAHLPHQPRGPPPGRVSQPGHLHIVPHTAGTPSHRGGSWTIRTRAAWYGWGSG